MPINIVVGAQWGDEGKGRVVDWLSAEADIVARYAGGDNAGHTVTVGDKIYKLHLIPSGIIHPHTFGILGAGMVINPTTLLKEMEMLSAANIKVSPNRLAISHAAHLITPIHRLMDKVQEEARGSEKIGTTGRGIGPAYVDKTARHGIRVEELLKPEQFKQKMRMLVQDANHQLEALYHTKPMDVESVISEYEMDALQLTPYIQDISLMLRKALAEGKRVLAEGAQGTLLDLDHGTYPFLTSSSTTAPGALVGLGLGIRAVERVVGAVKAFQTRVGSGPFPTELSGELAERLRGTGENPWDEFGTTTGRARRVGWLDGVLLRYAVAMNGLTELAVTKMDILSGLKEIRICTSYRVNGQEHPYPPYGVASANLEVYKPVYEELPGWQENINTFRSWQEMPEAARAYIKKIEEIAGVPVRMLSVGPERNQLIKI